jgi:hypothetical protein
VARVRDDRPAEGRCSVNDRQIICTALGAGAEHATDALNIALEFAIAEAENLVDCMSTTLPAVEYSLAQAHSARLKALKAFIDEHMDVAFRTDGSVES